MVRPRTHPGQPVDTGAPEQVEQHGLGLVVGGVPGGRPRTEDGPAGHPGPGLEVGTLGNGHPDRPEGGAETAGGGGHDPGLPRRARAQGVVDVDGGDVAPGGAGQHQQGQGVGPARYPADQW